MNADAIQRVAVLGLGTMGHGIAQVFAAAGCSVRGWDEVPAARQSLKERVRANLQQMAGGGLLASDAVEPVLGRLEVAASEREAVEGAQFVVEAVSEQLAVKQALFARIEPLVAPHTILATNSSTFPVTQSAARVKRPERTVVTHWFNPPHLVPVVEIVRGRHTSEETMQVTMALHERIGKMAVRLNQELPGFLVNRVQAALIREVWELWERGVASAEDLDRAIRGTIGFRLAAIGPLQVCDFGGLDIWSAVAVNLWPHLSSRTELPGRIRELTARGHLGVKSGRGIFEYTPESAKAKTRERDERFLALAKLLYDGP